jgi:hypothetical protein
MTHRLEGKASRPRRNLREKLSSALALKKRNSTRNYEMRMGERRRIDNVWSRGRVHARLKLSCGMGKVGDCSMTTTLPIRLPPKPARSRDTQGHGDDSPRSVQGPVRYLYLEPGDGSLFTVAPPNPRQASGYGLF